MAHSAKKGKCSGCKVCRAYLREANRNQAKIRAEKPALSSLGERAVKADLPDADALKRTDGGLSGCPAAESPE